MRTFETRHKVPHSAENMFALVADVETYPRFVPLCESLRVRTRSESEGRTVLIADMTVAYKVFRETFTSRVTLDPARLQILVEYLDGPFSRLENRWLFVPLAEHESEVDLFLAYEFRSRTLQMLMGSMFDSAFARFSDAFEKRADEIYGPGDVRAGQV